MQTVEEALVVRLEASLKKFENQMARSSKVAADTATGIENRFANTNRKIQTSSNAAASGILRMTQISGRGRFVLQNTANQIGDIAVQMGSGTSAARALGQQLPQLLGGFGVLGGALGTLAPLLGTVAALGIPLAAAFLLVGDGAETTEEKVDALSQAIANLEKSTARAAMSPGDLIDEFGPLADQAQRFFEIQRDIDQLAARGALARAFGGINEDFGLAGLSAVDAEQVRDKAAAVAELEMEIQNLLVAAAAPDVSNSKAAELTRAAEDLADQVVALNRASLNLDPLADAFGITVDQARELAALLVEVDRAENFNAQAEAASRLAEFIHEATDGLKTANPEAQSLFGNLLDAADAALRAAASAEAIAGPISVAASEAARLANNLARSIQLNPITADQRDEDAVMSQPVIQDARGRANHRRAVENFKRITKPSGGRGGGAARADSGLREAEQLFDATRTKAEDYAAELERINELHRRFPEIVTSEVKDRAIKILNESAQQLGDTAKTLEQGLEDVFSTIVTGSGDARDAVSALIGELARMAASAAFKSLGIGTFFDSLFAGGFGLKPSAASGLNYAPGGPVRMNEFGTEDVILPRGSQVIPAHKSMAARAGGTVQVLVAMDGGGNMVPVISQVSGNVVAKAVPGIIKTTDRRVMSNLQEQQKRNF